MKLKLCILILLAFSASYGSLSDYAFDARIVKDNDMRAFLAGVDDMDKAFEDKKPGLFLRTNRCIDGADRLFGIYVPAQYNPLSEHVLIIYLHGGVNRKELMTEDQMKKYAEDWAIKKMADDNNYIVLYPAGQNGAVWWDPVGTDNVFDQIAYVKENYNIDDNAVFITGFSDGASASFYFAMCHPTQFAGFIPLSGHAGVANIDGNIQTYFHNLSQRPLHVVNTDADKLYPDRKMREMMRLAVEAGGNVTYRTYTGYGHDFEYVKYEIPAITDFINSTRRPAFRNNLKWMTDNSSKRNRIDWLEITSIVEENAAPVEEIGDYNMKLPDDRIMLGFYPDYEFEGPGIKVSGIAGDSTLCSIMGIKEGDIFIKMDSFDIKTMDDMSTYKQTKSRGDSTYAEIVRNGDTLNMVGAYPPVRYYPLFTRDNTTAYCKAQFIGNEYHIETANVKSISIYINGQYIDIKQPVKVFINGEKRFDAVIEPDIGFALDNLKETKDREKTYIKKLDFGI